MARTRARRFVQVAVATVVALAGLGLVSLGPSGAVLLWRTYEDRQANAGPTRGQVGVPIRDGSVTFLLHEIRCGADEDSVHGQICEVTIAARNEGTGDITVPLRAQLLRVAKGARHLPINADSAEFGTLAPQETATTLIRYDIPDDATAINIEVRAYLYSRGTPIVTGTPYPRPQPG